MIRDVCVIYMQNRLQKWIYFPLLMRAALVPAGVAALVLCVTWMMVWSMQPRDALTMAEIKLVRELIAQQRHHNASGDQTVIIAFEQGECCGVLQSSSFQILTK